MAERDHEGLPDDPEPAAGVRGAARGTGEPDAPERAGGGPRAARSTEYGANADGDDLGMTPPRETVDPDPHAGEGEG